MIDLSSATVMIVDDTVTNIDILVETLGETYTLSVAMDGESALEAMAERLPDLILLDIMMPGMDGYEVCEHLKQKDETRSIPIIFLTAMTGEGDEARGLALGAVDYITKPFKPGLVKARVRNQLELKHHRDHLEELVKERTRELELTQEVTIESMASLAEYRDPETGGHIKRTRNYLRVLSNQMKKHPDFEGFLTDSTIDLLYQSAPLHDIGKVAIEDRILLKHGKLTDEEFDKMKKHTVYGRDAIHVAAKKLGRDSFMRYAEEIAYSHQEKWNGSGYPLGLAGEDIPVSGRLMAVADVYDALISHRVYKKPFSHTKAVNIILEGKGSHFDPEIVEGFMAVQEEFRQIALQFADFDEEKEALAEPYRP